MVMDVPRFRGHEKRPDTVRGGVHVSRRRRFSREFKFEAVSMVVDQGRDPYEVSRELEIRPDMLRKWQKKFERNGVHAFPGSGRLKPEDDELRRLRRENERLRMERDILKKAVAICSDRRR
jgi:transposase